MTLTGDAEGRLVYLMSAPERAFKFLRCARHLRGRRAARSRRRRSASVPKGGTWRPLAPGRRRPFWVFLDEVQSFDAGRSGSLAGLLEQSAKFGLRAVLLNQNPERLSPQRS